MSNDEFAIDQEPCELAYQQIVEREAFNDAFEEFQERKEEAYWGGREPHSYAIDQSRIACLNEIVVNEHDFQQLIAERDRLRVENQALRIENFWLKAEKQSRD